MQKPNVPTVFIVYGATGDLIRKKIVPAFYHLYRRNKLPRMFRVIGVARRVMSDEEFRAFVKDILLSQKHINPDRIDSFLDYFSYHQGQFDEEESYKSLAGKLGMIDGEWKACSNKLFYLAVPPHYYRTILENLANEGLTIPCGGDEGWTRVLVEKPFGRDLKTAEELDTLLATLFKEEQIYRIDHYLAKEMLQNIIAFRFSNNLLEDVWNKDNIEKIEIKLFEKEGVESRGPFYDGVGALRDVGQNHILQMLSLVTMDRPASFDAAAVRKKRAEVLATLRPMEADEVISSTFRAQYKGYRNVSGVAADSVTETYFKLKATMNHPRWVGVPLYIESGKALGRSHKEISVTFRHPTPCLCPQGKHYKNKVVFTLEPKETITINFFSKTPGLSMDIDEAKFTYRPKRSRQQYVEEYEKLLLDCIEGNQLLFVSTHEVRAMWNFIDPIIEVWKKGDIALPTYQEGSQTIVKIAQHFFEDKLPLFSREIGVVGLGKMGGATVSRLLEKGWKVVGYNRTTEVTKEFEKKGMVGAKTILELIKKLKKPRIIYVMLTAGDAVDDVLFGTEGLMELLDNGDIVIDAGNSYYKDALKRSQKLAEKGIRFMDVGTSGGPGGARSGACLMIGGKYGDFESLRLLFTDLALPGGVQFFEGVGAGHFVKMIHNGIEYGMMQSIAEGFAVMKQSEYRLDLTKVADIYNHGSVIESRLIAWLKSAFELYGQDLSDISGTVSHTGEGAWTIKTAQEMGLKTKVIEDALQFRIDSEKDPSYAGKILSALRNQFGGHKAR